MFCPSMRMTPTVDVVEAQQQVEHGGLAAAGGPDQRRHLAGLGAESHAAQHGFAGSVGELHVVDLDPRLESASAGLSSSIGSVGGVSMISNSPRTPSSAVLRSRFKRASRSAGS